MVLNVGCGTFPAASALRRVLPGWRLVGVDLDAQALRRARETSADLWLLQADARQLWQTLRAEFGLVLVRHPDVFRRNAWREIFKRLPALVAPGGVLIVTAYAAEEIARICSFGVPLAPVNQQALVPPDMSGADRFVLQWRAPQVSCEENKAAPGVMMGL